jgi:orotate phosphoribosyltransferase
MSSNPLIRKWLYNYINDYCIERATIEDKKIVSGFDTSQYTEFCFMLRRGIYNPQFLQFVGFLFWEIFHEEYKQTPFQLCGMESAAPPLITGLALAALEYDINDLNCFAIRKEKKYYGMQQTYEGTIKKDRPVLIVDDLFNRLTALRKAVDYCTQNNLQIYSKAFSIVNTDDNCKDKCMETLFYLSEFPLTLKDYENSRIYNGIV